MARAAFEDVVAQLHGKQIVRLTLQLALDVLVDELVELLLRCDVACGERHLEELLVELGIGETAYLGYLQLELGVDAFQLLGLDLQYSGTLLGLLVELVDVDLGLVAHLLADEGCALLLAHRDQTHVGLLDAQLAVVERDVQRLVLLDGLDVDQTAVAAQIVGAVVLVHLLVDLDLVVGQLVLLRRERHVDLRSLADLEQELELGVVVEVEVALLVRRNHIAQIVDLLLLQILEYGIRRRAVRLLGQDALAVHLLDDAHRYHAGTESRDIGLALHLAQLLVYRLAVIVGVDDDLQKRCALLAILSCNIHDLNIL